MEGARLWSSMSQAVANAWCFSLRLGLGAGGPLKCEVCSGPGTELQVKELQEGDELTAGSARTDRLTGSLQRTCRAKSFARAYA